MLIALKLGGISMFYFDPTMWLVIPGLLLGLWAQFRVKHTFSKFSKVTSKCGLTAEQVSKQLLNMSGNSQVSIQTVKGDLTDHYDPRSNTLRLSQSVYGLNSISAIGVAAHECGHAMQQHDGYSLLKLRTAIVPVVNIGSSLYFPIFFLGIVFSWQPLITVGIICFSLTLLFSLITLPVEFDASKRAVAMLEQSGIMDSNEIQGVRSLLNAAAMSYVASTLSSLLQLIRLILISKAHDRD